MTQTLASQPWPLEPLCGQGLPGAPPLGSQLHARLLQRISTPPCLSPVTRCLSLCIRLHQMMSEGCREAECCPLGAGLPRQQPGDGGGGSLPGPAFHAAAASLPGHETHAVHSWMFSGLAVRLVCLATFRFHALRGCHIPGTPSPRWGPFRQTSPQL